MSGDQVNVSESFRMLHDYNTDGPPLAARLRDEHDRFDRFSRSVDGLLLDFSRTAIDDRVFASLIGLAAACGVEAERQRLFRGEEINFTEHRPVLHPLWRERNFAALLEAGEARELDEATQRMRGIAAALNGGRLPGDSGPSHIKHIVHIGIGGSLLGPRLLCQAFPPRGHCPQVHFLSSVDALDRERLLERIDPRETAVILVSKSFSTSEVLLHARRIRDWQLAVLERPEADRRLFAVSAAAPRAEAFGVPAAHVLQMGEWTGGRFSVWSPVGVTAAVTMGPDGFDAFLNGGAAMDRHFRETPLADNLPVILGMLSVWHRNVCGYAVRGVIPYDSRLAGLPGWLQQVEMESNGKSVDLEGRPVGLATAPVVMGDCGTDAQHALFQAFHQGTGIVPLDFIGVIRPDHADAEAQQMLLSHMLAQATALAVGRDRDQAMALMRRQGVSEAELESMLPHRLMPGNRPSIVLLLDRLDPESMGKLLVLYEHMVFVESVIWRINAFDQWGVELGKILADAIQPTLAGQGGGLPADIAGLDGLLAYIKRKQGT
ncbi:MAG: glucose-6-phosphate isomerase [Lysobacterales bacterium]|nr:MAG: glucose-6-phosphate isomerase [Xanthomonadales bacterium]